MSGHTPGPWVVVPMLSRPHIHGVYTAAPDASGHRQEICYPDGGASQTANASLIAAAPDLLSACKAMLRSIEALVSAEDDDGDVAQMFREPLLAAASAAIAKAEGK